MMIPISDLTKEEKAFLLEMRFSSGMKSILAKCRITMVRPTMLFTRKISTWTSAIYRMSYRYGVSKHNDDD